MRSFMLVLIALMSASVAGQQPYGEWFERGHWRFEVVDLDGRRIDKVLVSRL